MDKNDFISFSKPIFVARKLSECLELTYKVKNWIFLRGVDGWG
jgi:hypothetical protein